MVEFLRRDGELGGVGPHLRQGAQPGVAEERGVLHALGHHHARGLLEAAPQLGALLRAGFQEQREQAADGVVQFRTAAHREGARLFEDVRAVGQVAAVDREGGDDFRQGVRGEFAAEPDRGRHQPRQPEHLGVQDAVRDAALGAPDHFLVVRRLAAAQVGVEGVKGVLPGGVDEEPVHVGEGVVAGGALAVEVGRKHLAGFQDLLDQQVAAARGLPEPVQVACRVGQPVRVVDPEPVHQALAEPAEDLGVGLVKDLREFHPDAGQAVDGEEPAVVQVVVGPAPAHQLVVLPVMDRAGVIPVGVASLSQREPVVVVAEFAVLDLQRVNVRVLPQHGDPDPAAAKVPVDVERLGVVGLPALLEQGPPPRVLGGGGDADMVRDDVDEHPHSRFPGGSRRGGQAFRPAAVGVDRGGVGDVVAVVRTLLRRQDRREVDPVHAE